MSQNIADTPNDDLKRALVKALSAEVARCESTLEAANRLENIATLSDIQSNLCRRNEQTVRDDLVNALIGSLVRYHNRILSDAMAVIVAGVAKRPEMSAVAQEVAKEVFSSVIIRAEESLNDVWNTKVMRPLNAVDMMAMNPQPHPIVAFVEGKRASLSIKREQAEFWYQKELWDKVDAELTRRLLVELTRASTRAAEASAKATEEGAAFAAKSTEAASVSANYAKKVGRLTYGLFAVAVATAAFTCVQAYTSWEQLKAANVQNVRNMRETASPNRSEVAKVPAVNGTPPNKGVSAPTPATSEKRVSGTINKGSK